MHATSGIRKASARDIHRRQTTTSIINGTVVRVGMKLQSELVNPQVDGNGIIDRDGHDPLHHGDVHILSLRRYPQILDFRQHIGLNILLGFVVAGGKSRFGLNGILQLIIGKVGRYDFRAKED